MNETSDRLLTAKQEVREQESERIRQLIRSTLEAELAVCRDLHVVVIDVVERRSPELSALVGTAAGPAVVFLLGKIWRSFNAARILAQEGYGPDAMVVARSLVNGAIDLGYIVKADSEERARQWCAVGEKARRFTGSSSGRHPTEIKTSTGPESKLGRNSGQS